MFQLREQELDPFVIPGLVEMHAIAAYTYIEPAVGAGENPHDIDIDATHLPHKPCNRAFKSRILRFVYTFSWPDRKQPLDEDMPCPGRVPTAATMRPMFSAMAATSRYLRSL